MFGFVFSIILHKLPMVIIFWSIGARFHSLLCKLFLSNLSSHVKRIGARFCTTLSIILKWWVKARIQTHTHTMPFTTNKCIEIYSKQWAQKPKISNKNKHWYLIQRKKRFAWLTDGADWQQGHILIISVREITMGVKAQCA